MLIVTLAGAERLLARTLSGFTPDAHDMALRLYSNDYTPDVNSVLASFTEATFSGYFRQWLDSALWGSPVTVSGKAESTYGVDPLAWTVTDAGQTVYGYYVEESATGVVLWAERFNVPRVLTNGQTLEVTAVLTGRKQT